MDKMKDISKGVKFAFSDRGDGSMSLASGERESVLSNRNHFLEKSDLADYPLILIKQVHGEIIYQLDDLSKFRQSEPPEADAMITNILNVVLGIMTADCLPIIVFDKNGGGIGAVHAGRKGTSLMIIHKTVSKLTSIFNIDTEDVVAIIGAGIGSCCYEVEEESTELFRKNAIYKFEDIATPNSEGKIMLDLVKANKIQLLDVGLSASNIFLSDSCTCCDDTFFSYRRGDKLDRMMSVVALSSS